MYRPRTCLQLLAALLLVAGCASPDEPERIEVAMPGEFGQHFAETLDDPATADPESLTRTYRQQNMRQLSATYRALELILRYDAGFDDQLAHHAAMLADVAARAPRWFEQPVAAAAGHPGARALIWEEPERFASHLAGLAGESAELAERVERGSADRSALLGRLNAVRHQCLACHEAFRRR